MSAVFLFFMVVGAFHS